MPESNSDCEEQHVKQIKFVTRFADAIAAGRKTQTIRNYCSFKIGDEVKLTVRGRVLRSVKIARIDPILIADRIQVGEQVIKDPDAFAVLDGFVNFKDM